MIKKGIQNNPQHMPSVMRMHHFWAKNGPLALIHFFPRENVFYLAIFLLHRVKCKKVVSEDTDKIK